MGFDRMALLTSYTTTSTCQKSSPCKLSPHLQTPLKIRVYSVNDLPTSVPIFLNQSVSKLKACFPHCFLAGAVVSYAVPATAHRGDSTCCSSLCPSAVQRHRHPYTFYSASLLCLLLHFTCIPACNQPQVRAIILRE